MLKTRLPLRAYLPLLLLAAFILLSRNTNVPIEKKPEKEIAGVNEQAKVIKVVDGDTVTVLINDKKETVRVIGINTPETVDPRRKVECFGIEASSKAAELISDKTIELEKDESQSNRDKYNRLLRYVWIDGKDFGKQMISEGFAYEYTYDSPYKYQAEYKKAQTDAQNKQVGLWAQGACSL